jgi:hypothetical protein
VIISAIEALPLPTRCFTISQLLVSKYRAGARGDRAAR